MQFMLSKKKDQNCLIFRNNGLVIINQPIEDYYNQSKAIDNPSLLMKTLFLMLETYNK